MNNNEKANLLEEAVVCLDRCYWKEAAVCVLPDDIAVSLCLEPGETVSDPQYDALRRELKELRPNSTVFIDSHAGEDTGKKKIQHNPPLTSIAKASHEDFETKKDKFFKWMSSLGIPSNGLCQSYKHDGVSMAIYYVKGKLTKAGIRPRDGIVGDDCTENAKQIRGVPLKLPVPITCSIRGEVECPLPDFGYILDDIRKNGKNNKFHWPSNELPANPRNYAAGTLQLDDSEIVATRRLGFTAWGIEGLENPPYKTEIEKAVYVEKVLGVKYVDTAPFDFQKIQEMEEAVPNLEFEVDGVVVRVNSIEDAEQLGREGDKPTGDPRGAIAWKFAEEHAFPVLTGIEWNTGRTGSINPVALFDDVSLAGTNVGRATLFNIGFIWRKGINIGTTLDVVKAGKIIPKVTGIKGKPAAKKLTVPRNCPSCGEGVTLLETPTKNATMYSTVCTNLDCPAQTVNKLLHHLKIFGVLGLGDSKIADMVEAGLVSRPVDFYALTPEDVMSCGLGERESLLAVAAIHHISSPEKVKDNNTLKAKIASAKKSKKQVPLWVICASLGIPGAGRSIGKVLVEIFNDDFNAIRNATVEKLESIDGIGSITACSIRKYFTDHKADIDALLEYVEPEKKKVGSLTGLTFVFSGEFPGGRSVWQAEVEARGGKNSGSVSKKVSFVVKGPEAGSKIAKAESLGVPVIDLETLQKQYLK